MNYAPKGFTFHKIVALALAFVGFIVVFNAFQGPTTMEQVLKPLVMTISVVTLILFSEQSGYLRKHYKNESPLSKEDKRRRYLGFGVTGTAFLASGYLYLIDSDYYSYSVYIAFAGIALAISSDIEHLKKGKEVDL